MAKTLIPSIDELLCQCSEIALPTCQSQNDIKMNFLNIPTIPLTKQPENKQETKKKGVWTQEEDTLLLKAVSKYGTEKETMLIRKTKLELMEYFDGKRRKFDIPIKLDGTEFQVKVWKELLKLPYGETCSYLDIAKKIGNPNAARAVGMANNKNKIQIIIPCHRIIGSDKKLIGYAGGIKIKEKLLKLEKDNI